jgi:hypothetical protein
MSAQVARMLLGTAAAFCAATCIRLCTSCQPWRLQIHMKPLSSLQRPHSSTVLYYGKQAAQPYTAHLYSQTARLLPAQSAQSCWPC